MRTEILTKEQRKNYGRFSGSLDQNQISKYFTLDHIDLEFISKRRGRANRLGVALQLTCVRFLGTFPSDLSSVPVMVREFVAQQLSIGSITVLESYGKRRTTEREHRALIRNRYGYREYGKGNLSFRLPRFLYLRVWMGDEGPSVLFDLATSWLARNKILLPGPTTLTRLVGEIRQRAFETLWKKLADLPSEGQKSRLEGLLDIFGQKQTSWFDHYRKGPVRISSISFIRSLERYQGLHSLGIGDLDFSGIPLIKIRQLAKHASITSAHRIGRMTEQRRIAVLVAFVKIYEVTALDDALDVLELLVAKIVNERARPDNSDYLEEMMAQHGKIKKILPRLFQDIEFEAAPTGEKLLDIFHFLASLQYDKGQYLENPPLEIITPIWKRLITDKEGRISKKGYTICFLNHFLDALKRRDIYVARADRWGDPRMKLIPENQWKMDKDRICASLGYLKNGKEAMADLTEKLDVAYRKVASNFQYNDSVRLDLSGKHPSLTVSKLDGLGETDSLKSLRNAINGLLPVS